MLSVLRRVRVVVKVVFDSLVFVIMGLIDLLLYDSYIIGIICIVLAPFMLVLEIPLAYGFVKGFVNFFSDYKFRVVIYVL